MKLKKRIPSSFAVLALTCWAVSPASAQQKASSSAQGPRESCASLVNLALPNTRIISASEVTSASGNYCNVIGVIDERVSGQDPDHFVYGIGFDSICQINGSGASKCREEAVRMDGREPAGKRRDGVEPGMGRGCR